LELSWSTFLLEIVNFLVLVWILKRFLYKPVLDIIGQRRAGIEQQLAEAEQLHEQAERLKAEYGNRLSEWERERRQLRDVLARELDAQRTQQTQALEALLAKEREKAQAADARRQVETERATQQRALQQAAQFAARLLSQAAGPELEARLLDLLLDGLATLSEDRITALRTQWGEPPGSIRVASAFPLPAEHRQRLEQTLKEVTGLRVPIDYQQEPALLAGVRITVGAWILHTNLQDELQGFAAFGHATR
jgi:F-type H+-transporting ATPase subunit b